MEYIDAPGNKADDRQQVRGKTDYKEVLNERDFALFSKLQEVRKKIAEENGLPVYAVCTNEQLAEVAKRRPSTLADCTKIEGIGQGKKDKYMPALRVCGR